VVKAPVDSDRYIMNAADHIYHHTLIITIFIPTYDDENFIEKKLDILLCQTYPFHKILVYDCSTDRTPAIIQGYQKKIPQSSSSDNLPE
jgi:glycosyltransferase involved in cell wall biosynthesis